MVSVSSLAGIRAAPAVPANQGTVAGTLRDYLLRVTSDNDTAAAAPLSWSSFLAVQGTPVLVPAPRDHDPACTYRPPAPLAAEAAVCGRGVSSVSDSDASASVSSGSESVAPASSSGVDGNVQGPVSDSTVSKSATFVSAVSGDSSLFGGNSSDSTSSYGVPPGSSSSSDSSSGASSRSSSQSGPGGVEPDPVPALVPQRMGRYVVIGFQNVAAAPVIDDSWSSRGSSSAPATENAAYSESQSPAYSGDLAGSRSSPLAQLQSALHKVLAAPSSDDSAALDNGSQATVADSGRSGDSAYDSSSAAGVPLAEVVEAYYIDAAHMLVYVPPVVGTALGQAVAHVSSWVVYDVFRTAAGQALKLSAELRGLATHGDACAAAVADAVASGRMPDCANSGQQGSGATSAAADGLPAIPSSPLVVTVLTARGAATGVLADFAANDRIGDMSRAATPDDGRHSVVQHKCDATMAAVGTSAFQLTLTFPRCGVTASVALPPPPCACFSILAAVASHHAVRWLEQAATTASSLNYNATATIQSGCDADALEVESAPPVSGRGGVVPSGAPETVSSSDSSSGASGESLPSSSSHSLPDSSSHTRFMTIADERSSRAAIARPIWAMGINGSGEIISIADTGIDLTSCYFRDPDEDVALYPEVNPRHRKILSFACGVSNGAIPARRMSAATLALLAGRTGSEVADHGSHVAGSAAGFAGVGASDEQNDYNGAAPGARLFIQKLGCDASGSGGANGAANGAGKNDLPLPSDITELLSIAYDASARVSSNSWGFAAPAQTYTAVERLVDRFAYTHDDMLILFAAGNDPATGLYSPGRTKNVLTVGAHLNSLAEEQQNTVAPFSAFGPTYDARRKPELLGPGASVYSAAAGALEGSCGVAAKSGTSMSTALVAGGAALVRQFVRERLGMAAPSASLIKAMLVHSSVVIPMSPRDRQGYGRLDLWLVLGTVGPSSPARSVPQRTSNSGSGVVAAAAAGDEEEGGSDAPPAETYTPAPPVVLSSSPTVIRTKYSGNTVHVQDRMRLRDLATHTYCYTATPSARDSPALPNMTASGVALAGKTESEALKVTLVWTDPGTAVEGSSHSLVHDLDLVVVDAGGKLYYPHPTDPSKVFFDRRSNVEQVRVPIVSGPLATLFRVIVHGHDVRQDGLGQQYSLVVSAPGLAVKESCAAVYREIENEGDEVRCPGNCTSGRGDCDAATKECHCGSGYTFVDCSQCDAATVCNRHGACSAAVGAEAAATCMCQAGSRFSDAHCSVCAEGWFGPLCNVRDECQHGGVLDRATGVCGCREDHNYGGSGCYQGGRCQYCCDGFGGELCDTRSYWCDEARDSIVAATDAGGGFIQVNGYEQYPYSVTCRWNVTALPHHRLRLQYISYDMDPYDSLSLYDFYLAGGDGSGASSSGGGSRSPESGATPAGPAGEQAYFVRRDTNRLLPANSFTVNSTNRSLFLVFQSDWAESRAGFLLRYSLTPLSRCSGACAAAPGRAPGALTCGEAVHLMEWCVCASPYVGWHCATVGLAVADKHSSQGSSATRIQQPQLQSRESDLTRAARSTYASVVAWVTGGGAGSAAAPAVGSSSMVIANPRNALRPKNRFFVSETVLLLRELPSNPPLEARRAAGEALTRLPIAVNGYTLLTVQSVCNSTKACIAAGVAFNDVGPYHADGDEERTWIVDLAIVPFGDEETRNWITEVRHLMLGVSVVYTLRSEILSSNITRMQAIDLFGCPDSPTPTFEVPLRIPANMMAPGGVSPVKFEATVLVTLLWNASTDTPAEVAAGKLYVDAAVVATGVRYAKPLATENDEGSSCSSSSSSEGSSANVALQCMEDPLIFNVGTGERVEEPEGHYDGFEPDRVVTVWQFVLIVFAAGAGGSAVSVVSRQRRLRLAFCRRGATGSGSSSSGSGSGDTPMLVTTTSSSGGSSTGSLGRGSDDDERAEVNVPTAGGGNALEAAGGHCIRRGGGGNTSSSNTVPRGRGGAAGDMLRGVRVALFSRARSPTGRGSSASTSTTIVMGLADDSRVPPPPASGRRGESAYHGVLGLEPPVYHDTPPSPANGKKGT